VDEETLHFGFGFHYISSEYKVFKKAGWRDPFRDPETGEIVRDSLYSISSPGATGFGLGFVSDLKLSDHINLRFTPALAFADRFLNYEYVKGTVIEDVNSTGAEAGPFLQKKVTATMVDMPIGIKLKSDRRINYRVYLIGGIKYSMDIISKKKTDDSGFTFAEKLIKNKSHFLSYEAGIGFDFYFEFFKLSPELKLSNSFNNVLEPEDHPYSKPIDKLLLRNLQFSLYFE
jgi:hypothetical protein